MSEPLRAYVPPRSDEPLDAIQEALVRALVRVIVRDIRAELVAEADAGHAVAAPDAGRSHDDAP